MANCDNQKESHKSCQRDGVRLHTAFEYDESQQGKKNGANQENYK